MSRTPDYRVKALRKDATVKNKSQSVGAAWLNDNKSISIILDPFVVLSNRDDQLLITLFPEKSRPVDDPRDEFAQAPKTKPEKTDDPWA